MKLILENLSDLNCKGIYQIMCIVDKKIYIGSTGKTFKQRFSQHKSKLKNGKHACEHLQAAYNLYGSDAFEFSILEISKLDYNDILELETIYINKLNSCDHNIGFNMNNDCKKSAMLCKEVSIKVSEALKEKYKNGIPHMKEFEFKKGQEPWNKGIKIEDTTNYHKKKTITQAVLDSRKINSKKARDRSDLIVIYNKNNKKIKEFNSITDLVIWSKSEDNDLPLDFSRSKIKSLNQSKLSTAIKEGKLYRGLYFKKAPKVEKSL